MTDRQILYLALALIYLSECFIWVSSKGIAFRKSVTEWGVVFSSTLFGNESGGLALAYPLPFLGRFYMTYLMPVSFSPEGILNVSIETLTRKIPKVPIDQKFYAYSEIDAVENKGNVIWINNEPFCKCGSVTQATSLVTAIQHLLKQKDKAKQIDKYNCALLNNDKIKELIKVFDEKTDKLSIICNVQFFVSFCIAPALVYVFGSAFIVWSCIYLIISNLCIITMFNIVHKYLLPEHAKERINDSFKMFFCPPLSIRAVDIISLPYLSNYHPLAVAYNTIDEARFQVFAKQALLSFNFPNELIKDMEFNHVLQWHLDSMNSSVSKYLSEVGLDTKKMNDAPERSSDTNSFCPRCHTQFTLENGQCSECTGVMLIGYSGAEDANKQ